MEKEILNELMKINAIKLNFKEPYIWTSGIHSPIYCDNRLSIGNYKLRNMISDELVKIIKEKYEDVELIGGCATAGIPHATSIADKMELPLVYFRSKAKGHGTNSLIEGYHTKGQKIVIVEDLISTAKSVGQAIEEAKKAGLEVLGVVSIVNYNLNKSKETLKALETDYDYIISFEEISKYLELSSDDQLKLDEFIKDPFNDSIWK